MIWTNGVDDRGPARRVRRALGAAGAGAVVWIGLVSGGPALAAHLQTTPAPVPSLGGFNVNADGNAVDIVVDNATGLAGIHPLSEADFPEAESTFSSGPFGSALATVFWPGSAGADFGSLSTQLGFPSQLQPLTSKLNDPVRATAQYPAGPASAQYPPSGSPPGVATMRSTASSTGTSAMSDVTGQNAAVFTFSSASGQSSSAADSTARATSSSVVSGVSLLGGIIDIGSVSSTANAKSDGNTGTGSATTDVSGVKVFGLPATIGSKGLVLPNFASSLGPITGPVVQDAISQTISALGVTVTEFPAAATTKGAGYTVTSGGLSVKIVPPSSAAPLLEQAAAVLAPLFPSQAAIIPTLPGLLQGFNLTITLGRATASAAASPGFNNTFTPPPVPPASTPSASSPSVGPSSSGSSPAVSATPTGSSAPSVSSSPVPSSGGSSTGSSGGGGSTGGGLPAVLISLSKPLTAAFVLFGLAIAAAFAWGLWAAARTVLPADSDPACPLGSDH